MQNALAWFRAFVGLMLICVVAYGITMMRYADVGHSPNGTWVYILDRLTGTVCLTIPSSEISRCVARGKVSVWEDAPRGFEIIPDKKDD